MLLYPNSKSQFPLDRCRIGTEVELNADFMDDPGAKASELGIDWYDFGRGHEKKFKSQQGRSVTIQLAQYGALFLTCYQPDAGHWKITSIEFNPVTLLYGHNAKVLDRSDFITAMTVARDLVTRILARPDDAIHVIPGSHPESLAYWSEIEIPLNLFDPNGRLWDILRNTRTQLVRKRAYDYKDESTHLGAKDGALSIKIYRKDLQMSDKCEKFDAPCDIPIVRVELKLKGTKLLEHLGPEANTARIDGRQRVVSFGGDALVRVHKKIVSTLEGMNVGPDRLANSLGDHTGQMIGLVSRVYGPSIEELLDLYRTQLGCSDKKFRNMRTAAVAAHGAITQMHPASIFSGDAYHYQPEIEIPKLEAGLLERREATRGDDAISKAYRARK
jgi:hypothetical protein